MCGLAGFFQPKGVAIATADLPAMLAAISHRGPDGTGMHVSDDRRFQAGFARLAIIDLVTGDQPLVEENGRRVLLGNGEIYNYLELRQALVARGHTFATNGDMEPALKLWREKGMDFVHDLNGMYGLALYDRDDHNLVLVRDRMGVKPLYWAKTSNGGVIFASEIKALFASGLVRPEVDEAAVSSYIAHGYVPAPATLYRGVYKLPQGSLLMAGPDGSIQVERYWQPQPANIPRDPVAIREHLTGLLTDAVRLQLRSDVPLAALLSGGVDSGLLVALAARQMEGTLSTYTVRFAGASVDESPLAAQVANRYGTRHTVFDLSEHEAPRLLPRLAWFCDEPLADASLLPNFLINEILSHETRVVLNGTGGDELFAGYGRYFPLPIEQRYLRLPHWLRTGAIEPALALADPMTAWRLSRAEKFSTSPGDYLHDHSTQFPPPLRKILGNTMPPVAPAQRAAFARWSGETQAGMLFADLETYLPEDLLVLLDRTTMAVSVEGRVPFLDHRLVEAALAVPQAVRTPGGRQKALERTMAADLLPSDILNAPKQGFASPVPAWFAAGMNQSAIRLLTRSRSLERGWWTKEGIEHLAAAGGRHSFRLYALIMLELAVRLHVEGGTDGVPNCSLEEIADG